MLAIAILALCATAVSSTLVAPEKVLAKHLLDKYHKIGVVGRPAVNANEPVKVEVGMVMQKLLEIDSKGLLTAVVLLKMKWHDPFLDWDPKEFDDVNAVPLPADDVWTPDITILNDYFQTGDKQRESMEGADVLALENGDVLWIPRMTYKTTCKNDPNHPDQMICSLIGGSWVYDTTKIDIEIDPTTDTSMFDTTPGLELIGSAGSVDAKEFACCPGVKFDVFNFSIVIKKTDHCDAQNGQC